MTATRQHSGKASSRKRDYAPGGSESREPSLESEQPVSPGAGFVREVGGAGEWSIIFTWVMGKLSISVELKIFKA